MWSISKEVYSLFKKLWVCKFFVGNSAFWPRNSGIQYSMDRFGGFGVIVLVLGERFYCSFNVLCLPKFSFLFFYEIMF